MTLIFKASYDKANRTSVNSYRGPGLQEGLRILEKARAVSGLPVLSDVHEIAQVSAAAEVLDVIQIPAFLCRQTDLVQAAARAGRCVNLKKGQFLSPQEMRKVLEKALATGNRNILLTERGTSFGYNNLVVDFRSFAIMRSFDQPVVFDVTHSVQAPGGQGDRSGGDSQFIPHLARAGAAAGVDGFFFEVHDNPAKALSDGPNSLDLKTFPRLIEDILRIRSFSAEDFVTATAIHPSLATAIRVLEAEADAIRSLVDRLGEPFLRAVDLAAACSGKDCGHGTGQVRNHLQEDRGNSQQHRIAGDFSARRGCAAWRLRAAGPDDVVLAISKSGETAEVLQILNVAKRLGLPVIAMVGDRDSTLAQFADVFLDVSVAEEACPLGLAPTTSTAAALAMGDALAMALMERKGFGREDFASVHPAGSLGKKLLRVAELMHRGECHPARSGIDADARCDLRDDAQRAWA